MSWMGASARHAAIQRRGGNVMWLRYSRQGTDGPLPRLLSGHCFGLRKKTCTLHPHRTLASFSIHGSALKHLSEQHRFHPACVRTDFVMVYSLSSANCGCLLVQAELSDLVVALHASWRCLSSAVSDWAAKTFHFCSKYVTCTVAACGHKKSLRVSHGIGEGSRYDCTVCCALICYVCLLKVCQEQSRIPLFSCLLLSHVHNYWAINWWLKSWYLITP